MSDCRWAASLFAAAFLARLVALLGSAIFGTDSCHYLLMADWMREGRFHEALQIGYHPMYPLLIAIVRPLIGNSEQAGAWLSAVLGSAAAVPLFRTVLGLFGRPTAVLTALLYAFNPWIVSVQSDPMTEGVFMFFLFSSIWLTWRMMEDPSPDRGIVLGACAALAFLTRPEGLLAVVLAVGWPSLALVRREGRSLRRAGGVALTLVAMLLLVSPFLIWVKSERGRWAISARPSVIAAEKAVGLDPSDYGRTGSGTMDRSGLYLSYGASLLRLSLYGALIPFYVVGLASLKGIRPRNALLYFSYAFGQLSGVFYVLRASSTVSERYLMAGMSLMGALAALGMVTVLRIAARRWPDTRLRPALCGAAILAIVILPSMKIFPVRRRELLGYPGAAQWILERNPRPRVSGLEQIAYFCGSRSHYVPRQRELLRSLIDRESLDYLVYSEHDAQKDPEYVAILGSLDRLEPPVEYQGPPGTWKVYIRRVR